MLFDRIFNRPISTQRDSDHSQHEFHTTSTTSSTMLFSKKTEVDIPSLTPSQVEEMLKKAQRAEPQEIPHDRPGAEVEEAEYPHLNSNQWDMKDGVWVCCCTFENPLVHFHGFFPMGYLECRSCHRVMCERCEMTDIVQRLNEDTLMEEDKDPLRLFQVCPSRGLSHRAATREDYNGKHVRWVPNPSNSHSEMCPCGDTAKFNWPKYAIGEPWVYRINPAKETHELTMKQLQKKMKKSEKKAYSQAPYPQARDHSPRHYSLPVQPRQTPKIRTDSVTSVPGHHEYFAEHPEKPPKSKWEHPGFQHAHTNASRRRPGALDLTSRNLLQAANHSAQGTATYTPTQLIPGSRTPGSVFPNTNIGSSSLKRSPAMRGDHHRPSHTPRYVSYDGRALPTPTRPHPMRGQTLATADEYLWADDQAKATLKSFTGTTKFKHLVESIEGERTIGHIREDLHEELIASWPSYEGKGDPYAQGQRYAKVKGPSALRRAETYDGYPGI